MLTSKAHDIVQISNFKVLISPNTLVFSWQTEFFFAIQRVNQAILFVLFLWCWGWNPGLHTC
jgi:hypothetical protein